MIVHQKVVSRCPAYCIPLSRQSLWLSTRRGAKVAIAARFAKGRVASTTCNSVEEKRSENRIEEDDVQSRILDVAPSLGEGAGKVISLLLWAAAVGYAFLLSPNQTPARDQYFIEKLVGVTKNAEPINAIYTQLFSIMGIYPIIFISLLQPSGKSGNKIPAWPFTTLSFGLGYFALGLYFALWSPSADITAPPQKDEMAGWQNLSQRVTESSITAALLLLGTLAVIGTAIPALVSGQQWADYAHLFDESRLVHVTSIDFALLTATVPFWMSNDAQKRNWPDRDRLLPLLSAVPVLGPAIYLLLRPKSD